MCCCSAAECCPVCCGPGACCGPPIKEKKKKDSRPARNGGIEVKQHKNGSIEMRIGRSKTTKKRRKKKTTEEDPNPCCFGANTSQLLIGTFVLLLTVGGITGYVFIKRGLPSDDDAAGMSRVPAQTSSPPQTTNRNTTAKPLSLLPNGEGEGEEGGCVDVCGVWQKKPRCEDPDTRKDPWEYGDQVLCVWNNPNGGLCTFDQGCRCINKESDARCSTTTTTVTTLTTTTITATTRTATTTSRTLTTKTATTTSRTVSTTTTTMTATTTTTTKYVLKEGETSSTLTTTTPTKTSTTRTTKTTTTKTTKTETKTSTTRTATTSTTTTTTTSTTTTTTTANATATTIADAVNSSDASDDVGEDAGVGNSAGQDSQSSDTTGGRDPAKKKGANVAVLVSLIVVALIAFAIYAFWNKFTDQDGNIAILTKKTKSTGTREPSQQSSGPQDFRYEKYCYVPSDGFWVDTLFESICGGKTVVWRRKYFILTDTKLRWYSDKPEFGGKKEDFIIIDDIQEVVDIIKGWNEQGQDDGSTYNDDRPDGHLFAIQYTTDADMGDDGLTEELYMEAPTSNEKKEWIDRLSGSKRIKKKGEKNLQVFRTLSEQSPPSEVAVRSDLQVWARDVHLDDQPEDPGSMHSGLPNSEGIALFNDLRSVSHEGGDGDEFHNMEMAVMGGVRNQNLNTSHHQVNGGYMIQATSSLHHDHHAMYPDHSFETVETRLDTRLSMPGAQQPLGYNGDTAIDYNRSQQSLETKYTDGHGGIIARQPPPMQLDLSNIGPNAGVGAPQSAPLRRSAPAPPGKRPHTMHVEFPMPPTPDYGDAGGGGSEKDAVYPHVTTLSPPPKFQQQQQQQQTPHANASGYNTWNSGSTSQTYDPGNSGAPPPARGSVAEQILQHSDDIYGPEDTEGHGQGRQRQTLAGPLPPRRGLSLRNPTSPPTLPLRTKSVSPQKSMTIGSSSSSTVRSSNASFDDEHDYQFKRAGLTSQSARSPTSPTASTRRKPPKPFASQRRKAPSKDPKARQKRPISSYIGSTSPVPAATFDASRLSPRKMSVNMNMSSDAPSSSAFSFGANDLRDYSNMLDSDSGRGSHGGSIGGGEGGRGGGGEERAGARALNFTPEVRVGEPLYGGQGAAMDITREDPDDNFSVVDDDGNAPLPYDANDYTA